MINRKPTLANATKAALAAALTLSAFACHSNNKAAGGNATPTPQKQLSSTSNLAPSGPQAQTSPLQISHFTAEQKDPSKLNGIQAYAISYDAVLGGSQYVGLGNLIASGETDESQPKTVGDTTYRGSVRCVQPAPCNEIAVLVTAEPAKGNPMQTAAIFGQDDKGNWVEEVTSPAGAQYKSMEDAIQGLLEAQNQQDSNGKKAAPTMKDPTTQDLKTSALGG